MDFWNKIKAELKFSNRFIISILMLIIAVSFLSTLLLCIPKVPFESLFSSDFEKENAFYGVDYNYEFSEHAFVLNGLFYKPAFYLFISFAVVFFVISGSTIILKSYTETRKLIFASWLLYSIPAIVGFISFYTQGLGMPWGGDWMYLRLVGLFPFFINLFIQIVILLDKKTLTEWTGFSRKDYPSNYPFDYLKQRRISAIFFIICYIATIYMIIPFIFPIYPSIDHLAEILFFVLIPVLSAYFIWFFFGELIGRRRAKRKADKRFIIREILRGETILKTLSEKYNRSLEEVTYIINDAINNDIIFGSISADNLAFHSASEKKTTEKTHPSRAVVQQQTYTSVPSKSETTTACMHCGFPIESNFKLCPDCGKEVTKCIVCKLPIYFGEEIGKCSLCEAIGHLNHLHEWVKVNGKCPSCLQDLPIEGVIPISEVDTKK